MKTINLIIACIALLSPLPAAAQGHSAHADHPDGKVIRETTVDGYHLTYRVIDMAEKMAEMEMKMDMAATHHLMLYVNNPDGVPLAGATVGFLVEGPAAADQKVMAMRMKEGYGADVDLGRPGKYTIHAKALAGDAKLIDRFIYQVE